MQAALEGHLVDLSGVDAAVGHLLGQTPGGLQDVLPPLGPTIPLEDGGNRVPELLDELLHLFPEDPEALAKLGSSTDIWVPPIWDFFKIPQDIRTVRQQGKRP